MLTSLLSSWAAISHMQPSNLVGDELGKGTLMNWLRTLWLAVVVLTACFALPAWSQAQDEKAAVAQTLNDYYHVFSKLDLRGALAYYHEPVTFITTQNVIVATTRSEGNRVV